MDSKLTQLQKSSSFKVIIVVLCFSFLFFQISHQISNKIFEEKQEIMKTNKITQQIQNQEITDQTLQIYNKNSSQHMTINNAIFMILFLSYGAFACLVDQGNTVIIYV